MSIPAPSARIFSCTAIMSQTLPGASALRAVVSTATAIAAAISIVNLLFTLFIIKTFL
jgi:hypothetical protein